MTLDEFRQQISAGEEPRNVYLRALYHDARGDWKAAHDLVDHAGGEDAAWIHAYLHRVEGDQWNANYWYRRADKKASTMSLQEEWEELAEYFLSLS